MIPPHLRQSFTHTQWSLAMQAEEPRAVDAHGALVRLCSRYWYPVYAYLRRSGHGPDSARQNTRRFLQHLFRHFRDRGAALGKGRFRQFLLARLQGFLASERYEPPVNAEDIAAELFEPPPDIEVRNQRDNPEALSPEHAFQQSFAFELLARAMRRLGEEASQTGHADMYAELEPFLASDPSPAATEEIAQRLGMRSVAIAVALRRLRQRFREVIDTELADTVASADELQAEQQALYAILRQCG
jgi:hypothetical protein